jgi:hypothetical protein
LLGHHSVPLPAGCWKTPEGLRRKPWLEALHFPPVSVGLARTPREHLSQLLDKAIVGSTASPKYFETKFSLENVHVANHVIEVLLM